MAIYAVANTKGGVGKSALACLLAARRARDGEVLLVDADTQLSAEEWIGFRARHGDSVRDIAHTKRNGQIYRDLIRDGSKYADVVVDCPGSNNEETRAAITAADRVLMPVGGKQFHISALKDMIKLIRDLRSIGVEKPILAVLNDVEPRSTRVARTALSVLGGYPEDFTVHPMVMWTRPCVEAAISSGLGLHELKPGERDARAEADFETIYRELFHGQRT